MILWPTVYFPITSKYKNMVTTESAPNLITIFCRNLNFSLLILALMNIVRAYIYIRIKARWDGMCSELFQTAWVDTKGVIKERTVPIT